MNSSDIVRRSCRFCGAEIPPARLKALPDTLICVKCSERKGGEFELEVTTSSTGKAGSLKRTGQDVEVRRKPKPLK
jgi:DksA/TraR C4-type zinc finger protein